MNYRGKALYKLKSSSSTIEFYYCWKYLLQVINALDTFCYRYCFSKLLYSVA